MKKTTPLKILLAGGAVYAAAGALLFYEIMDRKATIPTRAFQAVNKKIEPAIKNDDERLTWFNEQEFEDFEIKNKDGHKLKAHFLKADEPSDKYIVCAHGYRSSGKGEFRFISKFLHESGFNILLVDHRASGDSEGKYLTFGYKEAEDLLLWVQYLVDFFGDKIKIGLYGVSMGCATVTTMCGSYNLPENVKFAVADCGYTSAKDEFEYNLKKVHLPSAPIIGTVDLINKAFSGCYICEMSPLSTLKYSKTPMLFIHGGKDDFVPTAMVYRLFDACSAPKDIYIAPGAGHAESYQRCSDEYEKKFIEFSDKYIKE